jgi:putative FmdB family regulatory protein
MPLYDVACRACGATAEVFQAMDAKQPTRCPLCGKKKVVRVLVKPPAAHNTYSPCHPRKHRGRGY